MQTGLKIIIFSCMLALILHYAPSALKLAAKDLPPLVTTLGSPFTSPHPSPQPK